MRKSPLTWAFLLLLPVFAYIACQKEYRPGFSLDPNDPSSQKVTTTIAGRVINELREPVEGALVTAGNISVTTDNNGYFNLVNTTVPSDAAFVRVQMQGYFLGSRTIMAQKDAAHHVQIELIPIKKTGEFTAASGGTVTFPKGGSAIFPPSAIVRQSDGSAYTGRVDVSQFFIDPTTEGFTRRMPGDLKGVTSANELRALQSFGMMAIQLNGESGELLQVAPNKKVDLRFPIPANLTSTAPASIPLWFFDEEKGLWREEGSATKTGTEYVGQVSHFTFWNCDEPLKFTEINFTLKDLAGNPQVSVYVEIKKKSDNTMASSYTDAEGRVKGWIPVNEALELSIYNTCQELIHKRDIGPYTTPAKLGEIKVDPGPLPSYDVSAIVTGCDDQPLKNGYLNIWFNGSNYRFRFDGDPQTLMLPACNIQPGDARITAYDADKAIYIEKTTTFNPGPNNLGVIKVCDGALTEFLKLKVDGKDFIFTRPADTLFVSIDNSNHLIWTFRLTNSGEARLRFPINSQQVPYSTTIKEVSLFEDGLQFNYSGSGGTVNVTKYGAVNSFMEGSFSGRVADSVSGRTKIPITGSFRVMKLQ